MDKKTGPASNGQTRAIVHIPRVAQAGGGSGAPLAVRGVGKTSGILPMSGHCAEQYQRHARVYIPEIPAIVLDITR